MQTDIGRVSHQDLRLGALPGAALPSVGFRQLNHAAAPDDQRVTAPLAGIRHLMIDSVQRGAGRVDLAATRRLHGLPALAEIAAAPPQLPLPVSRFSRAMSCLEPVEAVQRRPAAVVLSPLGDLKPLSSDLHQLPTRKARRNSVPNLAGRGVALTPLANAPVAPGRPSSRTYPDPRRALQGLHR